MVDLKVDVPADVPLADCFVSVRVGETQKLSRLAGSRTYCFPQAGDRRYGKIEVYRRIGSCGVDVDPVNEGVRQVQIGCGDAGVIRLDVEVSASGKAKAVAAEPEDKSSSKSKAAKEYLRKHSLELQLSEAMQAVLRSRPEDPVKYLCEVLMKNVQGGGVALPTSPAGVQKAAAQPSAAAAKAAPCVELTPFGQYHASNFRTLSASGFGAIYAKFPGRPAAAAAAAAAAADAGAEEDLMSADAMSELRRQACLSLTAAVESGRLGEALSLTKGQPPGGAPVADSGFPRLPSVGSWLAPRPPAPFRDEAPAQVQARAPAPGRAFQLRPSVGTWLAPAPAKVKGADAAAKPAAARGASAASAASGALVQARAPPAMKTGAPFVAHSGVFGPYRNLGLGPRMLFI